jgi:hypothetical protein
MLGTPLVARAVSYGRWSRRDGVECRAEGRKCAYEQAGCRGHLLWGETVFAPVSPVLGQGCWSTPVGRACPVCSQWGIRGVPLALFPGLAAEFFPCQHEV